LRPAVCGVCGAPGASFGLLDRRDIETLAQAEGEVSEEAAFDGVGVKWTREARAMISAVKDGYIRRRARAQAEKTARVRSLAAIDTALIEDILGRDVKNPEAPQVTPHVAVENEAPSPLPVPSRWEKADPAELPQAGTPRSAGSVSGDAAIGDGGTAGAALAAPEWTDEAVARLNRVPAGFMRENTRLKIEEHARETGASRVTLEVAEGGLERARRLMAEMIASYTAARNPSN
jgi:hypothetical protein